MSKSFLFIINTDSYAGNFEREMCAYSTGIIGDCEVGDKQADDFIETFNKTICDLFERYIEQRPDEHGCYRSTEMYNNSPTNGNEYNSLVIYFEKQPTSDMITIMKKRSVEYGESNNIKVLGFELKSEETIVKTIDIII